MVSQSYAVNLMEEYVLRGNAAILKCHIPSFVSEYVTVVSWIISEDGAEELDINLESDHDLGTTLLCPPGLPEPTSNLFADRTILYWVPMTPQASRPTYLLYPPSCMQ